MAKNNSIRFWLGFWAIAAIFLAGFYLYLQPEKKIFEQASQIFPGNGQLESVAYFANYFSKSDQEKTFLVLFQNNLEIRPGGGFIGSFGILRIKDGQVKELQIHDSGNFDGRVPKNVPVPFPMAETLRIQWLQLRDSNWSPDFPTNAQSAERFYYAGQGQEKFDGVIAITTNVLTSFLKATGPIEITGYPGTYGDENAVHALEYQVEKAFEEQGISRGERKSAMNDLGRAILAKVSDLNLAQKVELAKIIYADLNRKDIQLFFKDEILQAQAEKAGWAGKIDQGWDKDYFLAVDANLGAWKSDYYVKRSVEYTVDLSAENPRVVVKINYNHTAKEKDFMTKDYLTYLRLYVPENSSLETAENFENPQFGSELGKKYFGAIVRVPLNSQKTVTLEYSLPKNVAENYVLKIQKQAGLNDVPIKVSVKDKNGSKTDRSYVLNSDLILND